MTNRNKFINLIITYITLATIKISIFFTIKNIYYHA